MKKLIRMNILLLAFFVSSCTTSSISEKDFISAPIDDNFEQRIFRLIPNAKYYENEIYELITFESPDPGYRDIVINSLRANCEYSDLDNIPYFASSESAGVPAPQIFRGDVIIKMPAGSYLSGFHEMDVDYLCADYTDTTSIKSLHGEPIKSLNYKKYIKILGEFERGSNTANKIHIISFKDDYIKKAAIMPAIEKYVKANAKINDALEREVFHIEFADGENDFRLQCEHECATPRLTFIFNNTLGKKAIHRKLNDIVSIAKDGTLFSIAWKAEPDGKLLSVISGGKCTLINNNFEAIINPGEYCTIQVHLAIGGLNLTVNSDYTMTVNGITRKMKVRTEADRYYDRLDFRRWGLN